jgi:hypothetical protein
MKAWLKEHRELLINACLAGAYFGVATYMASDEGGAAGAIAAAAAAARFIIGYLAKHIAGIPTIVVDE